MAAKRYTSLRSAANLLRAGKIGVLPTDTIYGIVGSAFREKIVDRIYRLRRRDPKKPMIILISSLADLGKFSVRLAPRIVHLLQRLWPGKVSVILPCSAKRLRYLHRGINTLAFRLPAKKALRTLLKRTGPLVAPSANSRGNPAAKTIGAARKYFGDRVDFYMDGGRARGKPSTLISILGKKIKVLREGAVKISYTAYNRHEGKGISKK